MKRLLMLLCALMLMVSAPSVAGPKECKGSADDCLTAMKESIAKRGWLGIEYEVDEESGYPLIFRVVPGSPAESGGLQPGDYLTAIEGTSYKTSRDELWPIIKEVLVPGNEIAFTVKRDDAEVEVSVTAGRVPDEVAALWVGRHLVGYHHIDDKEDAEGEDDS